MDPYKVEIKHKTKQTQQYRFLTRYCWAINCLTHLSPTPLSNNDHFTFGQNWPHLYKTSINQAVEWEMMATKSKSPITVPHVHMTLPRNSKVDYWNLNGGVHTRSWSPSKGLSRCSFATLVHKMTLSEPLMTFNSKPLTTTDTVTHYPPRTVCKLL